MPAPSLVIPEQGEEWFPVRMREWARLKEKIDTLRKHRRQWSNLGWALLGIGSSAGLSWVTYFLGHDGSSVIAIVTLVVAVAGIVGGTFGLVLSGETQKSIDVAVRETKILMLDMEAHLNATQRQQIQAMTSVLLDA